MEEKYVSDKGTIVSQEKEISWESGAPEVKCGGISLAPRLGKRCKGRKEECVWEILRKCMWERKCRRFPLSGLGPHSLGWEAVYWEWVWQPWRWGLRERLRVSIQPCQLPARASWGHVACFCCSPSSWGLWPYAKVESQCRRSGWDFNIMRFGRGSTEEGDKGRI